MDVGLDVVPAGSRLVDLGPLQDVVQDDQGETQELLFTGLIEHTEEEVGDTGRAAALPDVVPEARIQPLDGATGCLIDSSLHWASVRV